MGKTIKIFCLCIVLLSIAQISDCQDKLVRRNSFSLGPDVIVAKFSSDYTLLAVLKTGKNKLYSYNPMTFQLIGQADLQPNTMPADFEIFGNDIIIGSRSNLLLVYQRKPFSAQLILKQKVTLKSYGGVNGMKLQKLTEDFNDKSQATSTRHLVVWGIFSQGSFEVYKYVASQPINKLTFFFNKVYPVGSSFFSDFEFFDEKFLVFGMRSSATVGETYLLELANTSKIVKIDSKVTFSMKAFNLKPTGALSTSNYLAISRQSEVSQFRTKGKSIQEGGKLISSIGWGKAFSDNNRMIGFYNESSLCVYRDSQLFYETYPTYTAKLQQINKPGTASIYVVAMPQNNTGELISNHCYENGQPCFYYYSLCAPNTYYTTNALGKEVCKKCTSDVNCEKCLDDACVKCNVGYNFNQNKKCQLCSLSITGCTSCSQDGKICHTCDTKQFEKDPLDNVCLCFKGTVWDAIQKKCVSCSSKVENCAECLLHENTYQCTKCSADLNRIPSQDGKTCLCNSFYFENNTKQCQLCDPFQKCQKCTALNNCQKCDDTKQWTLNNQGKCECMQNYVQVNNKCLFCGVLGCKTCQTDTKCKSCQDGFQLDQNQQCVCNQDRFLNEVKKQCQLCFKYMTGCYQCSSSTQCDVCDIKLHRQPSPNAGGKCVCKSQYTENSKKECVLCTTPGCLNCQGENYCTSCNKEKGFTVNPLNGKCSCLSTKFLDNESGTCKECSQSLTGCQACDNNSTCKTCNATASFESTPENGSCKCISNFFVTDKQCLRCQVICEHCNKCVIIVGQEMQQLNSTSVGCAECDDGFEVKNSRCLQKSSNIGMIVGISIGVIVILSIVFGCWIRKRNKVKQLQKMRKSREQNSSLVKMLLKQNSSEVITMDRTQSGKNNSKYESMFSGNINYSISSQQREIDKKSFNETLKAIERERQREYEKKNSKNSNSYSELGKDMKESKKPIMTQQQVLNKQKQSLFGHRGKG